MKKVQTILAVLALTCTATIFSCTKEQEENKANVQTEVQTDNGLVLKEAPQMEPPIYSIPNPCLQFGYIRNPNDSLCLNYTFPFHEPANSRYYGICGIMISMTPNSDCYYLGGKDTFAIAEMEYNNGLFVLTDIRFNNVSEKDTNLDKMFAPLAMEGEIYIGGISIIPDETMNDEDFEDVEFPAKKYPFHKEGSDYVIYFKQ